MYELALRYFISMQQKNLATTSKLVFLVIISHLQYHIFKQECTACTLTSLKLIKHE